MPATATGQSAAIESSERRWASGDALYVAAAISTTALLAAATAYVGPKVLAGLAAVVGLGVVGRMDVRLLPATALVAFALVPITAIPVPSQNGAFSPALLVGLVFAARAVLLRRPLLSGPHLFPVLLLSVWVTVKTVDSAAPLTSAAWSINFLLLVAVPALLLPGWPGACRAVESAWIGLGAVLGAYAALETVLQSNPLFGSLHAAAGSGLAEGAAYRATTTLGQPLVNGAFFSVALLLAGGRVLSGQRGAVIAAAGLAMAGVLATASRGALVAIAVATLFLGLRQVVRGGTRIRLRWVFAAILAVGLSLLAASVALTQREATGDTAGSNAVRLQTYRDGASLAEREAPWGAGAGLADVLKRELPTGNSERGVESSALQIAISLGAPGVVLFAWLVLASVMASARWRPDLAAAVLALVVCATTFNLIEAVRPGLVMAGLLVGLAAGSCRVSADERGAR